MEWKQQAHPVERAAIAVAGVSFGAAIAFALFMLAPLAGTFLTGTAGVGGLAAAFGGLALLTRIDQSRPGDRGEIRLIDFVEAVDHPEEEGSAERAIDEDELLLDDPIVPISPDSRVVRLFNPEQPPEPLPEPGELAARIVTYLDSERGKSRIAVNSALVTGDASAALHAALADIRRSLR